MAWRAKGSSETAIFTRSRVERVARRAGDARVDGAFVVRDIAVRKRDVAAVERTQADEILECALGVVVFRREHEARGIAVEPVHDARAVFSLKCT